MHKITIRIRILFAVTLFQHEFARIDIKSRISHHMAKFLNFPKNLTTKIGVFSQVCTIVVTFYHGRSATRNLATSK